MIRYLLVTALMVAAAGLLSLALRLEREPANEQSKGVSNAY